MAKPSLAQDQTVEEILASIRQVINGEPSRAASSSARPDNGAMAPARPVPGRAGTLTSIRGGQLGPAADAELEEPERAEVADTERRSGPPTGRARVHDFIETAIEQALDRVDPEDTRAEMARAVIAEVQPPLIAAARPHVDLPPVREPSRAPEPASRRVEPAPRAPEQAPRPTPPLASRGLLSPRTNAAVAASFDELARTLATHGSRDIDQTVEDLLRPMLKGWLEDNLPSLVERLVREEIERVSRGGR